MKGFEERQAEPVNGRGTKNILAAMDKAGNLVGRPRPCKAAPLKRPLTRI
jgi:hypothetical protein